MTETAFNEPRYDYIDLSDEPDEHQRTRRVQGRAKVAGAIVGYTLEYPLEEITDPVPALVVPGYGGVKSVYSNVRRAIAESGKAAITYRSLRSQSLAAAIRRRNLNPASLPMRAANGVMSDVQETIDDDLFDFSTFDLVGHSMGGFVSVCLAKSLAERNSDRVRSVTMVASAGLEDHNTLSLLGRVPRFIKDELIPALPLLQREYGIATAAEALHYVYRNPGRTFLEGLAVSNCDIRDKLSSLGELGVRTAILNFKSDRLISNQTTAQEVGHIVDHCETHPDASLGHLAPQVASAAVAKSVFDITQKINA